MKLFHLFALSALILSFSGKPAFGPVKLTSSISRDSTSKAESADMIPWELDKRLIWDDFLCEPKVGSDAVASTSTSLGIAYQLSNHNPARVTTTQYMCLIISLFDDENEEIDEIEEGQYTKDL